MEPDMRHTSSTPTLIKALWIALLAGGFGLFSLWYGGRGQPISPQDGAELLARLEQAYGATADDERGFLEHMTRMIPEDDGREFYAVNLERLKAGEAAAEADRAYGGIILPLLLKHAAHPVFVSERAGLMLGTYGAEVDRVAVVRYRSLRDMINMVLDPAMKEGEIHKFAALDHTEVFITRPVISFLHIRLLVGLCLLLIGLAGLKLIDAVARRGLRSPGATG